MKIYLSCPRCKRRTEHMINGWSTRRPRPLPDEVQATTAPPIFDAISCLCLDCTEKDGGRVEIFKLGEGEEVRVD